MVKKDIVVTAAGMSHPSPPPPHFLTAISPRGNIQSLSSVSIVICINWPFLRLSRSSVFSQSSSPSFLSPFWFSLLLSVLCNRVEESFRCGGPIWHPCHQPNKITNFLEHISHTECNGWNDAFAIFAVYLLFLGHFWLKI